MRAVEGKGKRGVRSWLTREKGKGGKVKLVNQVRGRRASAAAFAKKN